LGIINRLDMDAIAEAVLNAPRGDGSGAVISPVAKETALGLVEGWIDRYADEDFDRGILAVEAPFFMWLNPITLVIGVMDRIDAADLTAEGFGVEGCEWKTKAAPTSKRYGEESWLMDMENGSQLGIYGLALREGYFVQGEQVIRAIEETCPVSPCVFIRVRAAVKSSPPTYYPADTRDGVFRFEDRQLESTRRALLERAAMIRAAREEGEIPWQMTGQHCFRQYGRTCPFFEKLCKPREHPTGGKPGMGLSPGDPGAGALRAAMEYHEKLWGKPKPGLESLPDPIVILSASSYELGTTCMEKYRIISGGLAHEEPSTDLDIGTGFHAGVGEVNKQLMKIQREGTKVNGESH
jgi:hypothetical protein